MTITEPRRVTIHGIGDAAPWDEGASQLEESAGAEKFVGLGLTFDDVLLVPAASNVLPAIVDTSTPRDQAISLAIPTPLRRHGYRHRGPHGHCAGAGGRHRRHPPQPLDRGTGCRGRQGQALGIGHDRRAGDACRPTRQCREALAVMERYHISGVPITDEDGRAGRHPDQPRSSLHRRHQTSRSAT